MPERYQPPTEFIEGLGIDFVKPPQPSFHRADADMRKQLSHALGYASLMPKAQRVHIPGTPGFSRHELLLLRDDSFIERPEGKDSHGFGALVCTPVSWDGDELGYRGFSVETTLGYSLDWTPLKYKDSQGSELTDSRDLDAARAILHVATKKPARRMQKAVTGYFLSGRTSGFNEMIGISEDSNYEDIVEGVKARLK